jgi:Oxidoreductase molybdopterin binding domain
VQRLYCSSRRGFLLTLTAVWAASALAQPAAAPALLEVGGAVHRPLAFTRTELLAWPRKDYAENRTVVQDGREVTLTVRYQGVPLRDVLDQAGLKPDRREVRKATVLLTAKDGYQASFSWGELYNSGLGDGVIVVLRQGNDELLDTDGLPALRSLQDTRSGPRHVRWLNRVDVLLPVR